MSRLIHAKKVEVYVNEHVINNNLLCRLSSFEIIASADPDQSTASECSSFVQGFRLANKVGDDSVYYIITPNRDVYFFLINSEDQLLEDIKQLITRIIMER